MHWRWFCSVHGLPRAAFFEDRSAFWGVWGFSNSDYGVIQRGMRVYCGDYVYFVTGRDEIFWEGSFASGSYLCSALVIK